MNHQTGPDADGADANAADSTPADGAAGEAGHDAGTEEQAEADGAAAYAVDSTPADGAAVSGAAGEAGHDAGTEEQAEADGGSGGPADDEVAAAESGPARAETGEPRVDAALTLLDRLTELPVTEHAAIFERVHAELTAVLGQLDPESAGADD